MERAGWLAPKALLAGLLGGLLAPLPAASVVDGQIDSFESGTTAGWSVGISHPAPPQNVATGGPDGIDDNYLRLTSLGGFGAGSRLAAFNVAQWSGDYLTEGVGAILVDLNNLGSTDQSLRLLFTDGILPAGNNAAVSTDAVVVPAGSGWITAVFPITPSDLTVQLGSANQALSATAQLWIFHNDDPSFPPDAFVAILGIDNVEALPEPSAQGALCAGLGLLAWLDRRRAKARWRLRTRDLAPGGGQVDADRARSRRCAHHAAPASSSAARTRSRFETEGTTLAGMLPVSPAKLVGELGPTE